jgi:lipopolysaccharide biosynthesis glycosyltransferase
MSVPLFIGYDPREAVAFHACVSSIIRHASEPVSITPVHLGNFRRFYRETHTDGSNAFIYARFLVPSLAEHGHAIWLDGDMILQADIAELWAMRSYYHAAQVVKHDYTPRVTTKYLGAKQEAYPRKNWSSVILWNCSHYGNRCLTPEYVEKQTGAHLHRFQWLADERIGELPKEWNWLDDYGPNPDAKLIHYTTGTPCWAEYSEGELAQPWHRELLELNNASGTTPRDIIGRAGGHT